MYCFGGNQANVVLCATAGKESEVEQLISAFKSYYHTSEVYYVYHAIQRFTVSITDLTCTRSPYSSCHRISRSLTSTLRHCLTWHYSLLTWTQKRPKSSKVSLKCILCRILSYPEMLVVRIEIAFLKVDGFKI